MTTQINCAAKKIFCSIIDKMEDGYLKLGKPDEMFMPLTVENTGQTSAAILGTGNLISFCHYYEQNGDLMQDPEVLFFVVDNRTTERENIDMVSVWPVFYQMAGLSIYREVMQFKDGKAYVNANKQRELANFCNTWMQNLKEQQNL